MTNLWTRGDIGCKWAPYLIYGPSVQVADALEFIRRTDRALIHPDFACNARRFCNQLKTLINAPGDNGRETWEWISRFEKAFGCVELEHFQSSWVASSWIGGPSGPVSPAGKVHKVANFGKWPSVSEIEADLDKLREFTWLTMSVYVWDSSQEEAVGDPDFGWKLANGAWERTTDLPTEERREGDLISMVRAIAFMPSEARECTWSIDQIRDMWGAQIEAARESASADTARSEMA